MPDYAAWSIEQLMAESERLGFGEPLKTKRGLVKRAQEGWESKFAAISLAPDEPPVDLPPASMPTQRPRSRSASSASSSSVAADPDELVISDDEDSSAAEEEQMPDFKRWPIAELRAAHSKLRYPSEPKTKEALVRRLAKAWLEDRGRTAAPSSTQATVKGPGRATAEMVDAGMRAVCVDDPAMYERILRYEPVKLSVLRARLESVLGTDRIKSSLVTQWLDRRSVTFYIEDPTRGKRPRH